MEKNNVPPPRHETNMSHKGRKVPLKGAASSRGERKKCERHIRDCGTNAAPADGKHSPDARMEWRRLAPALHSFSFGCVFLCCSVFGAAATAAVVLRRPNQDHALGCCLMGLFFTLCMQSLASAHARALSPQRTGEGNGKMYYSLLPKCRRPAGAHLRQP